MCEYFIPLISLVKPKYFGLSWIIMNSSKMEPIWFSQQNEKSKPKNLKQINPECLVKETNTLNLSLSKYFIFNLK